MEIKNNINNLDPYLNRTDLDKAGKADSRGFKVNTGATQATPADSGDKVSLSTSALRDVVTQEATNAPEVRQDRVDAIKARINSGTYNIDSRDIASKLLGSF
ncbi:flagellar biosynthesis anti-sigma factor FlgM [Desulfovibrio sp. OttesenSCG-928-C06]|nr:flagellar biosynthesis anti-sigma factor FlgM [Desulfovibrio sp. OttesenSCG-928-C06]